MNEEGNGKESRNLKNKKLGFKIQGKTSTKRGKAELFIYLSAVYIQLYTEPLVSAISACMQPSSIIFFVFFFFFFLFFTGIIVAVSVAVAVAAV